MCGRKTGTRNIIYGLRKSCELTFLWILLPIRMCFCEFNCDAGAPPAPPHRHHMASCPFPLQVALLIKYLVVRHNTHMGNACLAPVLLRLLGWSLEAL